MGANPTQAQGVALFLIAFTFIAAGLAADVNYILVVLGILSAGMGIKGFLLPSHFIDVPWTLVIGLVVVLPLLTALIVGLTARSRLPLVARLD